MFPRWKNDSEPGFVFELCQRLADRFDVRVIAPHAPGALANEQWDGIDVVRYRYMFEKLERLAYDGGIVPKLRKHKWLLALVPFLIFFQYLAARRAVRVWQPEIVHAHWIIPQGIVAAFAVRSGIKLLITAHGTDVFGLNSGWIRRIKRQALRRADAITVVGDAMRERVIALGAAPERVTTQPMGVNLSEQFMPQPAPRSHTKILFVGRLVDIKGVNYLIEAMPAVLERCPSAELVIAGFGPEEARLRKQAESMNLSNHVTFAGPVSQKQLPGMYSDAAVFVAPFVRGEGGEQEGFGIVVVEAIGCGCPVVASAIPAFVSLFAAHPDVLVEPANVASLAEKIIAVLLDPEAAQKKAIEIRTVFSARFDWSIVANGYANTLTKMLRAP